MQPLLDLTANKARAHFLKGSSYFNADLPPYLSFEPLLTAVAEALAGKHFKSIQANYPNNYSDVNYSLVSNKDGRFAWRPYELIHPVLYLALIDVICDEENWKVIQARMSEFQNGAVECCSAPVMSLSEQSDQAAQVSSWWHRVEQRSICYSLEFSHVLHTDVVDCYGSIYTHSIAWALHGKEEAKAKKKSGLLGNQIDRIVQAGRYGQTNGISQGSTLMDFVAEVVLGYVDLEISKLQPQSEEFRILRYRDDYRIFANSDAKAEEILKAVSDALRGVGMRLGAAKTAMRRNVVEGSVKPDKLAGM